MWLVFSTLCIICIMNLDEIRETREALLQTRKDLDAMVKKAFQPMAPPQAPMPPQGGAPMDPAMAAQGGVPMDPAMAAQGGAPMDPAMAAQGGVPMDPAMAAQGGAPPAIDPEAVVEAMDQLGAAVEEIAGQLSQMMQEYEMDKKEIQTTLQTIQQAVESNEENLSAFGQSLEQLVSEAPEAAYELG